jgi:hypothetical protein
MSEMICPEEGSDETNGVPAEQKPTEQGLAAKVSPALARLIEEVRNEQAGGPHAYNRMHNRHNRSR